MKISVAILSYNRCKELRRTLVDLHKERDLWHEIIVADNSSSDGTLKMVRTEFPDVQLIKTGGNFGIVGSNFAYSLSTGDWVLSLDDDSSPDNNSIRLLRNKTIKESKLAAVALSVRRKQVDTFFNNPLSLSETYGFSSAGVLFNRFALKDVGGYDPELFLFTNELHWTARALYKGWHLNKSDNAFVFHRSAQENRSSAVHSYLYTRNMMIFLLRYTPSIIIRKNLSQYLQWVFAYSILHRSTIYIRAARSAISLQAQYPKKRLPLEEEIFFKINPDWRVGFSYLG